MTRYLVSGVFRANFSMFVDARNEENACDIVYDTATDCLEFIYEDIDIESVEDV